MAVRDEGWRGGEGRGEKRTRLVRLALLPQQCALGGGTADGPVHGARVEPVPRGVEQHSPARAAMMVHDTHCTGVEWAAGRERGRPTSRIRALLDPVSPHLHHPADGGRRHEVPRGVEGAVQHHVRALDALGGALLALTPPRTALLPLHRRVEPRTGRWVESGLIVSPRSRDLPPLATPTEPWTSWPWYARSDARIDGEARRRRDRVTVHVRRRGPGTWCRGKATRSRSRTLPSPP